MEESEASSCQKEIMVIKKEGKNWVLRSRKTGKVLGRHPTKAKALRQERAIWYSKRRRNYSCVVIRRRDGVRQRYHVARPKNAKTLKTDGVIAEPKYDGSRTILSVKGNTHKFINRRGVDKTSTYPELAGIHKQVVGDAVLDGEIVSLDKAHPYGNFDKLAKRDHLKKPDLIRTRSKKYPLTFVAFDILKKAGKDVSKKPLLERKKLLDKTVKQSARIKESEYSNKPELLLKKVKAKKGEGIITKSTTSRYTPGKSRVWEKIKVSKENDVAIVGSTTGTGKRKNTFGALKMAVHTGRGFRGVGLVGTGFSEKDLKNIKKRLDKGEKLVARVKYQKIGSQGRYFAPRFVALRTDITQKQTHR
jgi:ATP-dependent DNA ligase